MSEGWSPASGAHPVDPGRDGHSPLVRRLADEFGVDLSTVAGTGPEGRVTRADVHRAAFPGQPLPEEALLAMAGRPSPAEASHGNGRPVDSPDWSGIPPISGGPDPTRPVPAVVRSEPPATTGPGWPAPTFSQGGVAPTPPGGHGPSTLVAPTAAPPDSTAPSRLTALTDTPSGGDGAPATPPAGPADTPFGVSGPSTLVAPTAPSPVAGPLAALARPSSPAQPAPTDPATPSRPHPAPAEPRPAQPVQAQPVPAQPAQAQPGPAQPAQARPTPTQPTPTQPAQAQPAQARPVAAAGRPNATRVRLDPAGARSARAAVQSWTTIPQATVFLDIEAGQLFRARDRLEARFDVALPLEALIIRLVLPALDDFPVMNAAVEGDEVVLFRHRSVAFTCPTSGTVAGGSGPRSVGAGSSTTAVVADVDGRPLDVLARTVADLARRAAEGSLRAGEQTGQTFTISDVGAGGASAAIPLVPPGTTGIVTYGRPRNVVRLVGDSAREVSVVTLSGSFDHRVIDNHQAARFLARLGSFLEDPVTAFAR